MRSPANARFHAAVFASTDPAAITTQLVGGTIADIQANVPPGGCWRQVPAGVHRAADMPPLGELPTPVIVTADPGCANAFYAAGAKLITARISS